MRTPQLLVCERDRKAAPLMALLRETALSHGWWLRDVQDDDVCLRLLREAGPAVLVLEIGRRLPREFVLLNRIKATCAEAAVVVVGGTENVPLSNLSWDLGADYVLFPPLPQELLPDIVAGLMQSTDLPRSGERA